MKENYLLKENLDKYEEIKEDSKKINYFPSPNIEGKFYASLLIIFIFFITTFKEEKLKFNKVCLCAIAKEENRYIREFVEYYKNYDIDKIYIFDNNDKDGEKFEDVIDDYIKNGFVELIDYKEIPQPQLKSYNDCYKRFNSSYDWLIFFDIDEFIYLKDFTSFKSFLNDKRFDRCNRVQFNWIFYTDNNQLYYENKPVRERFTEKQLYARGKKRGGEQGIKSVLRGNIKNLKITCPHALSANTRSCDGFGKPQKISGISTKYSDFEYYYLEHYACKSTEEFIINKLKKTDVYHTKDINMEKIKVYFGYNEITKEKIDLIERETKYNLSIYRNQIAG